MAQHKQSLRQSLRSALSHKRLADQLLDLIVDSQNALNATSTKLAADAAGTLDTDYSAGDIATFDFDEAGTLAQHKTSLRKSLRSALANKWLADEIIDSIEEIQLSMNVLHAKLDAEAGVLASTDFVSSLLIEAIDADGEGRGQYKASPRISLRSALSHARLADVLLEGIVGMQEAYNAMLAILDSTSVAVNATPVSVINPDDK